MDEFQREQIANINKVLMEIRHQLGDVVLGLLGIAGKSMREEKAKEEVGRKVVVAMKSAAGQRREHRNKYQRMRKRRAAERVGKGGEDE